MTRSSSSIITLLCLLMTTLPQTVSADWLGLTPSEQLHICTSVMEDCPVVPAAAWYFQDEIIALATVPVDQNSAVRPDWLTSVPEIPLKPTPIWLASSLQLKNVRLIADGAQLRLSTGKRIPLTLTEQIPANQAFWNQDTTEFFNKRSLNIRGEADGKGGFIARTVWPNDFRLNLSQPLKSLERGESVEQLVRDADQTHQSRLIWQRSAGFRSSTPEAVIGLMLNGAQGDDDEAMAGHFAVVTGRFMADGSYRHWLVNNFYNLDSYNEKAIIAAPTPMDNYLADLNSGQNYYRPSYMLVAVMSDSRLAEAYQFSVNEVFNHFYQHDFVYNHAAFNCAGVSMDIFRALGWSIPMRGREGRLKAVAAYFLALTSERSLTEARKAYDYMMTERTRLYPAQAFDSAARDLLAILTDPENRQLSTFELQLVNDIEQLWFVSIPQIPSSRAAGSAPAYDIWEYIERTPDNRNDWQTVESPPRAFPEHLKQRQPVNASSGFMPPATVVLIVLMLLILSVLLYRRYRK
ncbi:hypothetical protein [Methylophaga lonarensis]|uniref:hypothetical protein n=1 Tax=Methylophaga lonarensis TaxID=999151 RepID=UPI003D2E86A1